jgi:hypothetical protein
MYCFPSLLHHVSSVTFQRFFERIQFPSNNILSSYVCYGSEACGALIGPHISTDVLVGAGIQLRLRDMTDEMDSS